MPEEFNLVSFESLILKMLSYIGLDTSFPPSLMQVMELTLLLILVWVSFRLTRSILASRLPSLIRKSKTQLDDALLTHGFFSRVAHLVPAVTLQILTPAATTHSPILQTVLINIAMVYLIFVSVWSVYALFNTAEDLYEESKYAKRMPITGFIQVLKLILFIVALLLIVSQLLNKSPTILLSGLGAITAIVILVFRDTILGFVSGINIVANRTINNGDWIEMPKYGANGNVIAIGLTTVKVRNWDQTISTVPTYAVISEPVKNWRGMEESGGRRIKRAIRIDIQSIKFCDEKMLEQYSEIKLLNAYIAAKQEELAESNADIVSGKANIINSRKLTNVGCFRAYLKAYLEQHPLLNQNMTLLVRQLEPTETGLPIEIYTFSADKVWANYEGIQSDIFDHALAMLPVFELRAYQRVTNYS